MTRTGAELAIATLELLNVVADGVKPSPGNMQYMLKRWEELAQNLRFKELYADDDDEIPLEVFTPITYILAAMTARRYGKKAPEVKWAFEELAIAISVDSSGETMEMEQY